jgi:hypothetical protein
MIAGAQIREAHCLSLGVSLGSLRQASAALLLTSRRRAKPAVRLAGSPKRACFLAFAVSIPLLLDPAPAHAEVFFGLFKLFSQPVAQTAVQSRHRYNTASRKVRHAREAVRGSQPSPKLPRTPQVANQLTNPVPKLLADRTLRRGDIVMFPEGARVFLGQSRTQHTMSDFEPIASAAKAVPQATRKLVATLRPGWNGAWSAERTPVAKIRDVKTTASITRTGG